MPTSLVFPSFAYSKDSKQTKKQIERLVHDRTHSFLYIFTYAFPKTQYKNLL